MAAIDVQIVNVALPTLGRDFHASIAQVQWTVIGYVLSLAVLIPASGWLGDRFGTRRTFLVALATFTAASVLCGASQNLRELVGARVLQGAGGGILTPSATAMLFRAFPPERRARITRLLVMPIVVGPASAPILGGVFTQALSWRWVFFVNVPFGAAVFAFCAAYLPAHRPREALTRGRFDAIGFVLGGGGLSLTLYALSEGPTEGWGSAAIVATGLAGVVLLGAFVRRQLREAEPVLNLRLLHDRLFRATNIVGACSSASFLGCLYLAPSFLQEAQHHSAISSGTTTFLEAIGVFVSTQSLGRLYPRIGPRWMAGVGASATCLLMLCFLLVDAHTSLWILRGQMFLIGAANSAVFLSVQTAMFTTVSSADTGHASAIYNTGRQASVAVAVAVLSAVVAGVGGSRIGGFHAAFAADAAIAGAGALFAFLLIRTADAAASMARRRPPSARAPAGGRPG